MKKLCMCIASLLSLHALPSYSTVYTGEGIITGMFSGEGNIVGIFHSATWYNPANCPSGANDKSYLIDYGSAGDWNKVHSMLLAAYISNTKIKIGVNQTECYAGYPVIMRVAFSKGY